MQRIDGYFLYQVGAAVRPLTLLNGAITNNALRPLVWNADQWLQNLLQQDLVQLRTCRPKGWELAKTLQEEKARLERINFDSDEASAAVGFFTAYAISTPASEFQTLVAAELSLADIYVVSKKGAYDTTQLAENGVSLFPQALAMKVPEAIFDATQAARCIAFELPTAAAFHMHLILERVMRAYYAVVTGGQPPPDSRGIRAFVDAMKGRKVGEPRIMSALMDVAKFHRNPVLHPEEKLDTIEDAMALLGTVYTVLIQMLKQLPEPELKLVMQDAENKTA